MSRHAWALRLRLVAALCALAAAVVFLRLPLGEGLLPSLSGAAEKVGLDDLVPARSAKGFLLQITSEPKGAAVRVNGVGRGTTPLFGNVPCHPGDPIRIEVTAEGHRPWVREVVCRDGGSLVATATLDR
ncbi:MAG: PEGA domain-containing protein [Acidobacteriota bacterium]